jgi:hypothetical protein
MQAGTGEPAEVHRLLRAALTRHAPVRLAWATRMRCAALVRGGVLAWATRYCAVYPTCVGRGADHDGVAQGRVPALRRAHHHVGAPDVRLSAWGGGSCDHRR